MSFSAAVPQSGILGSGDNRHNRAPAINAGENFDGQVEDAAIEHSNGKRLCERDPNILTEDEVKASRRHLVAVETFEAQATHGMGNGAILAAIANLMDTVTAMDARMQNIRIRERNRQGEWVPVLVERPGPNAMGVAPAVFPPSEAAVGAMNAAAIGALQNAYNLPAGRFGGVSLAVRRTVVMHYIREG